MPQQFLHPLKVKQTSKLSKGTNGIIQQTKETWGEEEIDDIDVLVIKRDAP